MARASYQRADPKKKAKLIEAAAVEFAEHGYELASINRIILAAGLSKGSVYYYFEDKVDLAVTVFQELAAPWLDVGEFRSPSTPDEFWAEMHRMTLVRSRQLETKRVPYECVMRISNAVLKDQKLAARIVPLFEPSRARMNAFLEQGVKVGALRQDLSLATLVALIQAAKTAAYTSLYPGDQVLTEAELQSFSDLVIDLARRLTEPAKG